MSSTLTSCEQQQTGDMSNPLLEAWDTPFEIAPFERIKPDHYLEAFDVAIEEQRADIAHITSDSTEVNFFTTIVGLDQAGIRLAELGDLFEMCEMAISDEDWVRVSGIVKPKISMAMDSVWMNDSLFERVKSVYDGRADLMLNKIDSRLLEITYRRFVRGGAELNEEQKSRMMSINSRLATLSSRFSANLIADSDASFITLKAKDLDGLHGDHKRMMSEEANRRGLGKNNWVVTVNPASMIPFLTHSKRRDLREQIYKAYVKRGANDNQYDNRAIVAEMTALRQERAKMLGYENHAEYVIEQQMAGSAKAAYELLDSAWDPALKRAIKERDALQRLLSNELPNEELKPWDWWYYMEVNNNARVKLNDETLRPYFALDGVRVGAFTLANRLYGITFRPVAAPLYEQSCVAYEVLDRDGSHLGILYFDLFARANKSFGAWCGNLREQRTEGGYRVTPVVAITCNFPEPSKTQQTLLSIEQVETLFHEFGHALHFIFQNVDYRSMSAERVEGDFVEFPSQVMENWALAPEMLRLYALHYRTSRPITEELMKKIEKLKRLNQGFETITYLSAALLDLELQQLTDLDGFDVDKFEENLLRRQRELIDEIGPKYHLPYFAHPFVYDYSAGYYFYLWSEVLDKDCFEVFRRSGDVFSNELAAKLRREVLQRGSEASGRDLYRAFKDGDPSREPMLRAKGLLGDIEEEAEEAEEAENGETNTETKADLKSRAEARATQHRENNNSENDEK